MDTFKDERGLIQFVSEGTKWQTVILISSTKGAIRANHYHKTDTHLMHIIKGRARYVEQGRDQSAGFVVDRIVEEGDQILTVPDVPHAMEFLEDSQMLVLSTNPRQPDDYLNEIVPCKVL